jgi:hypothetical protein
MQFDPSMHAQGRQRQVAPPTSVRLARGAGWGLVYGQWWTLLNVFWTIFWASTRSSLHPAGIALLVIVFAVVFGFAGCLLGVVIGAANPPVATGAIFGIVAGLVFCGLEILLSGSLFSFINIFFWFVTGRFVGALITAKVRQPILL